MRNQYFHSSRRHDFDADGGSYRPQSRAFGSRRQFSPAPLEAPSGPPVRGVVKWFDPGKGFGFIQLSDGSGDAFLHSSVLAWGGIEVLQPGESLEVRIGPGHKGPHVTQVLSVDPSMAVSAPRRSGFSEATSISPPETSVEQAGTVKWFNAEKGYGFIALADGQSDIFVHASALERSGLPALDGGQQVVVDIGEGRKGPQAVRVRLV